jgi:catechol 2,3-dioxygenase-like lactoylglutathione lyase family enzyme
MTDRFLMGNGTDMIKTHGLSHLSLDVADPEVSLQFYEALFGVREYFRDANCIQVLGPGDHDVLAFVKSDRPNTPGGISHFGFRLTKPDDIDTAIETAKAVGANIIRSGEFGPGLPFLFIQDPDGYEIEIWFE